jgi:hypothetical protein
VKERGVHPMAVKHYRIGVTTHRYPRHLHGAIIFPSLDGSGGYAARLSFGGYSFPKGMARKDCIYNGRILQKVGHRVYLVEGPFDAVGIWPLMAVATYGRDISKTQFKRLCAYKGELVIAYDGDSWRAARSLAWTFELKGVRVSWLRLPAGYDPAEIQAEGILELRRRKLAL